ncbi:octopamine receptor beta-2R-like [Nematostella vectensis]|uniref:octopamine receptor beta-2R-like n=1 Tax=Nematostella vectensis TaxID=45351 RepID=UPI00138FF2D5|nr:octopamine receptor beta-2R-like [Nematostella vectensis]
MANRTGVRLMLHRAAEINASASSEKFYVPFFPPTPADMWFWAIRWVIFIITAVGNGLVIHLIMSRTRLRVTQNFYVLSLAIADLFVVVGVTPPEFACSVWYNCNRWPLKVVYDMAIYSSVFNLCGMTLDRYIAICHPMKYHIFTQKRTIGLIIGTSWGLAILTPLPYYFCLLKGKYTAFRYLQMMIRFFFDILPFFILIIAYLKMLYVARKQKRQVQHQRSQLSHNYDMERGSPKPKLRQTSSVRVIGSVIMVFVACYTIAAYKGWVNYVQFREVPDQVIAVARILYHVNSAANCVVYALFKSDIRRELKRLFRFHVNDTLASSNGISVALVERVNK